MKTKMTREIPVLQLVGDKELGMAIGYSDPRTLKQLRMAGLPYRLHNRDFVYDPDEVRRWLLKNQPIGNL